MDFTKNINGIDVNATYSDESVQSIFLPLLKKLTSLQKEKNKRILVMLAAPPGTGKTTLCEFLAYLSRQYKDLSPITVIGMDGFHHYQDYLLSHSAVVDGEEICMVKIKGAPITFDLNLLEERIKRVSANEICGWPEYNRITHNPCEDAITVSGDIVILEGNYLLLDYDGWENLEKYADYTIRILANENDLFERLVDRKIKSGTQHEAAIDFVNFSDMRNVRTCLEHSKEGDLNLKMLPTGEYQLDK